MPPRLESWSGNPCFDADEPSVLSPSADVAGLTLTALALVPVPRRR